MNDKFKCTFEKERSNEVELVASNLEAILKSSTYKLAHEDIDLLNTDEMRGVRMLSHPHTAISLRSHGATGT